MVSLLASIMYFVPGLTRVFYKFHDFCPPAHLTYAQVCSLLLVPSIHHLDGLAVRG